MTNPSRFKRIKGWAQDHPGRVNFWLSLFVAAHAVVAHLWVKVASPGAHLVKASSGDLSALFLGAAGVAAMVAGFAGVVVIFALGNESERFRVFRSRGSSALRANWTSCVSAGFTAAFLALMGAGLVLSGQRLWGWLLEASVLILAHATVRLAWLLRKLTSIVAADDDEKNELASRTSVAEFVKRRNAV